MTPEQISTADPTRLEDFAKTGTAAKWSGTYNQTAGYIKRKFGELTDDVALSDSGANQQLIGKIHRLVGSVRNARSAAMAKLVSRKTKGQDILRKHGAKLIDVATEFVDDLKKAFLE